MFLLQQCLRYGSLLLCLLDLRIIVGGFLLFLGQHHIQFRFLVLQIRLIGFQLILIGLQLGLLFFQLVPQRQYLFLGFFVFLQFLAVILVDALHEVHPVQHTTQATAL